MRHIQVLLDTANEVSNLLICKLSRKYDQWLVRLFQIVGNKLNNVDVVYTPWYNLRKTASMDVGQVGFHNPKLVSDPSLIALIHAQSRVSCVIQCPRHFKKTSVLVKHE